MFHNLLYNYNVTLDNSAVLIAACHNNQSQLRRLNIRYQYCISAGNSEKSATQGYHGTFTDFTTEENNSSNSNDKDGTEVTGYRVGQCLIGI